MKAHALEFDPAWVGEIDVGASPDVVEQAILSSRGTATTVSGPVKTIDTTITFNGTDGRVRAVEAQQLFGEPNLSPVAVSIPAQPDLNGYYAPSSVDRDVILSQDDGDDHHAVPITLTRVGTQQTHLRAIETNQRQADHEFGNETDAYIGLPDVASKVRWFDTESELTTPAESVEAVESENGPIELYDIEDGDTLVYEIDYGDDSVGDCRVYDGGMAVYDPTHVFDGEIVLDNGLLRLYLDEQEGSLEAERWGPDAPAPQPGSGEWGAGLYGEGLWAGTTGAWVDVDLDPPSTIDLYDIDITSIGMVRDEVQLTFDVDGSLFALDVILQAGHDTVLVDLPDGQQGPIPDGLGSWLSPIAAETLVDANASKALVSRSDVQR